ncbi:MAG: hypothetical protein HY659_03100 [Rhizobiales bacterium]|nr:hypothetical protein [Hyphomicrobiales bacterium]
MEIGSVDRLNTIMMSLSDWSEELRIQGYPIAARLLAMANLELRMKRHNISDSDFQALCATLDINRIATNGEKLSYPRRGLRRSTAHHGRADESSDRQIQHQAAAATSHARETDF